MVATNKALHLCNINRRLLLLEQRREAVDVSLHFLHAYAVAALPRKGANAAQTV